MKNLNQRLTIVALTFIAFVGSATAANVDGELRRKQNNADKIALIHAPARPQFAATISDLEGQGQKPYIVHSFRDPKTQAAIKAKGHSKVAWSFHNAQTRAGKPDALAMDVVDARYFWQTGNDFWLMLASAGESHRLDSGLFWGLPASDRKRIRTLIATKNWKAKYRRGWDAPHLQITGVSLREARKGKRPAYR